MESKLIGADQKNCISLLRIDRIKKKRIDKNLQGIFIIYEKKAKHFNIEFKAFHGLIKCREDGREGGS